MTPETAQLFSQWKSMEGALFASGRRFLDRGADVGDTRNRSASYSGS